TRGVPSFNSEKGESDRGSPRESVLICLPTCQVVFEKVPIFPFVNSSLFRMSFASSRLCVRALENLCIPSRNLFVRKKSAVTLSRIKIGRSPAADCLGSYLKVSVLFCYFYDKLVWERLLLRSVLC
ncbi:hypothetical protein GE061_017954, partial [Apolygus lucorum]